MAISLGVYPIFRHTQMQETSMWQGPCEEQLIFWIPKEALVHWWDEAILDGHLGNQIVDFSLLIQNSNILEIDDSHGKEIHPLKNPG